MSETVSGVLTLHSKGGGFLRDPARSYQPTGEDVFVPQQLIRNLGLCAGAAIIGKASKGSKGDRLVSVDTVCGMAPEKFRGRTRFDKLTALSPTERFRIGDNGNITMRMLEMIAPIGKGTRGLIVSPPKAGKTQILEELANAITACEPETRVLVVLVDERPEEVTHFRRRVNAEVVASSSDQSIDSHVRLSEAVMAYAKCELECGNDLVILVDSLTRMARAFNNADRSNSRTMSGGVGAGALDPPRKFFGLARNIEHGGSVTVIASALIETGSRMDDLIFQEFKGTGNSELVLSRSLAESRIFPAVDLRASGTRRDDLMYTEEEMLWLNKVRRFLAGRDPRSALQGLIDLIGKTDSNDQLFDQIKV
jgi:transcription termination factor Rho